MSDAKSRDGVKVHFIDAHVDPEERTRLDRHPDFVEFLSKAVVEPVGVGTAGTMFLGWKSLEIFADTALWPSTCRACGKPFLGC